jgi:molecular chaperone GrpE (heat shock protein)
MSKRHIPIHDGDAASAAAPTEAAPSIADSTLVDVGAAATEAPGAGAPAVVEPTEAAPTPEPAPDEAAGEPAAEAADGRPAEPSVDPLVKALLAENERMRKALEEKDATLQRYIAAHKKAEAEFAKVRTRLEGDVDRRVEVARGDLVGKLFPVLDDLERSLESARKSPSVEALVQGVDMVLKSFLARLEGLGVTRYSPEGAPFDPGLHEAMGVLPAPAAEQNNTVLHVYQPGYRAGDTVLRPARVIVGKFGG